MESAKQIKIVSGKGFDPLTSGLWALHASTAPPCSFTAIYLFLYVMNLEIREGNICQRTNPAKVIKMDQLQMSRSLEFH